MCEMWSVLSKCDLTTVSALNLLWLFRVFKRRMVFCEVQAGSGFS